MEGLAARGVYYLSGTIEETSAKEAIEFILDYNHSAINKDGIKLFINSVGGSVTDAFALIDVMAGATVDITTIGVGEICSAALMVFMAGNRRILTPNTMVLSHQFSAGVYGKDHELTAARRMLDQTQVNILRHYEKYTGLDKDTIMKELLGSSDVWLTPEQAKKYNLCDEIRVMP